MFPRSCSVRFAEMPPLRRILVHNCQVTAPDRRPSRAGEFFQNGAMALAGLWVLAGLLLYFKVL